MHGIDQGLILKRADIVQILIAHSNCTRDSNDSPRRMLLIVYPLNGLTQYSTYHTWDLILSNHTENNMI
jgi:hypothetical protein